MQATLTQVALAVFLLIAGLRIHHGYAVLTACHPPAGRSAFPQPIAYCGSPCHGLINAFAGAIIVAT